MTTSDLSEVGDLRDLNEVREQIRLLWPSDKFRVLEAGVSLMYPKKRPSVWPE